MISEKIPSSNSRVRYGVFFTVQRIYAIFLISYRQLVVIRTLLFGHMAVFMGEGLDEEIHGAVMTAADNCGGK